LDAQQHLGRCRTTIHRYVKSGVLESTKVGHSLFIKVPSLLRLMGVESEAPRPPQDAAAP
jgi:hypothetical protein